MTTTATPRLDDFGDFLTVDEAAQVLRIGRNTMYDRIADHSLPGVRLGRRIVIPKAALLRMTCPHGLTGAPQTDAQDAAVVRVPL
jgi:excisionase family DNA binding protein